MKLKAGTAWGVAIAGLLCFEGYQLATGGQTLSNAVWTVEPSYPIIPFLSGLLCGHLFFSRVGKGV